MIRSPNLNWCYVRFGYGLKCYHWMVTSHSIVYLFHWSQHISNLLFQFDLFFLIQSDLFIHSNMIHQYYKWTNYNLTNMLCNNNSGFNFDVFRKWSVLHVIQTRLDTAMVECGNADETTLKIVIMYVWGARASSYVIENAARGKNIIIIPIPMAEKSCARYHNMTVET